MKREAAVGREHPPTLAQRSVEIEVAKHPLARDDRIEGLVGKWKRVGIGANQNHGRIALPASLCGTLQHGGGGVDANPMAAADLGKQPSGTDANFKHSVGPFGRRQQRRVDPSKTKHAAPRAVSSIVARRGSIVVSYRHGTLQNNLQNTLQRE